MKPLRLSRSTVVKVVVEAERAANRAVGVAKRVADGVVGVLKSSCQSGRLME
jgi:hypothetical protein